MSKHRHDIDLLREACMTVRPITHVPIKQAAPPDTTFRQMLTHCPMVHSGEDADKLMQYVLERAVANLRRRGYRLQLAALSSPLSPPVGAPKP
jgi:hypothetical protein